MRIATVAASGLILLGAPGGASAKRSHRTTPAKCAPRSHVLLADAQAQVYAVREGPVQDLNIRGCVYGQRRSFLVTGCGNEESGHGPQESELHCLRSAHVTLRDAIVAYEVAGVSPGMQGESGFHEWYVFVQDLRTGRVLHEVPTGTPLRKPEPRYVGVGDVVALVLKKDGSVAWIAEDNERSPRHGESVTPYFDVYEVDKSGTRLLAAGTDIDPSSLALSAGGFGVGLNSTTIPGSTVYWSQDGKAFSATLG